MSFNPILLCFPIAFIFIIWLGIHLIKKIKVETVSNQDKTIATRTSVAQKLIWIGTAGIVSSFLMFGFQFIAGMKMSYGLLLILVLSSTPVILFCSVILVMTGLVIDTREKAAEETIISNEGVQKVPKRGYQNILFTGLLMISFPFSAGLTVSIFAALFKLDPNLGFFIVLYPTAVIVPLGFIVFLIGIFLRAKKY